MIRIGTCSWKYDSWRGIVYSDTPEINYLKEYSANYNTVEIDQWFWSLFEKEVVLPDIRIVENYKASVPDDFLFTIKLPNSISLTHYYTKNKTEALKKNPHFLSADLFFAFIDSIKCLQDNIGCLILQFEYLNKVKISSQSELQDRIAKFFEEIKSVDYPVAIEIRNPYYMNERYFSFLAQAGIPHVFLEGYYMPPVIETFNAFKKYILEPVVIRLHGPDRSGIETLSGKQWNSILINRDNELIQVMEMIKTLNAADIDLFLNVNNHYEGCAPKTITKIKSML